MIFSERLTIDLSGYESWLRLGSINFTRTDTTISVEYHKNDPVILDTDEGRIIVRYEIFGPITGSRRDDNLSLKEIAYLDYYPTIPLPIDKMLICFRSLEDLFIILTDSDYCFKWPALSLIKNDRHVEFEWYFYRLQSSAEAPSWNRCLTNFVGLKDNFGRVTSTWIKKRRDFGPGFYLYLGTRRDWRFYSEHLFVNLIWGLEALHRKKQPNDLGSETKDRVTRIIHLIDNDKDKKWLKKILRNAHEPNLERRLLEIMEPIAINIDKNRLRQFGTRCAQIRNDISHFGEQRNGLLYEDFIKEVTHKARALATLYHMIILHEIGIDKETINDWIYVRSSSARTTLVEGGLLDEQTPPPRQG